MNPFGWWDAAVESLKNLKAAPWQSALVIFITFVLTFASFFLTISEVGGVHSSYENQVSAGRFAFVITAGAGGEIPVATCDGISRLSGVASAGAIISDQSGTAYLGTTTVRILEVSRGYARFAWPAYPTSAAGSAIAPPDFAQRFGLQTGDLFRWSSDGALAQLKISYTPSKLSRIAGVNDALVIVGAPTGSSSQCLVSAKPADYPAVGEALRGWFGPETVVVDYIPNANSQPDEQVAFEDRASRFTWLLVGLLLIAVLTMIWFSKRNDLSLYRVLGFRERHILVLLIVDAIFLVVTPMQIAALTAIWLASSQGDITVGAVGADWGRVLALVALAPLVNLVAVRRSTTVSFIKGH